MPRITTPKKLTNQQERVLERLLVGDTVTSAAKSVRVDRSTVHRWLREDLTFQAAYNECRHELQAAYRARLLAMVGTAVGAVEHALANGDARTALKVLGDLGLLSPPVIGSGDEKALETAAEWAELAAARQREDLEMERLMVSLLPSARRP